MSHIILISPDRSQVETHEVDSDLFCKVWDLVHQVKKQAISADMSFGRAAHLEAVRDAMANSMDEEPETQPEPDPKPYQAPQTKPAPSNGDADFAASLAALFT